MLSVTLVFTFNITIANTVVLISITTAAFITCEVIKLLKKIAKHVDFLLVQLKLRVYSPCVLLSMSQAPNMDMDQASGKVEKVANE